jgi:hypothetical protein
MTYPDGIDALINVNANDTLAAGGHAARHNSTNTALAEVRDFLASGSANTVLTAGSVVPTWDLVDPVSIANGSAGYVLTAGSAVPTWAPVAAGGKILQIVRATDSTNRSTTSTSFVDVTGMSVTITPQKNDSAILLIASMVGSMNSPGASDSSGGTQITDSSNNAISGAESVGFGESNTTANFPIGSIVLIARATPATTSAVTYKVRFRIGGGSATFSILNSGTTGQLYAIEVSA